jgi:CRISPR-associated protein Csb1
MSDGLVYPPTYDKGQHIFRPAWVNGEKREAVLLDSVQSQANRIELAILAAHRRGDLRYPDIRVDVKTQLGDERYSVLELSHRIYDAALRMCALGETLFPLSDIGRAVYQARADRASALFTHAPITLTLGGWGQPRRRWTAGRQTAAPADFRDRRAGCRARTAWSRQVRSDGHPQGCWTRLYLCGCRADV